MRKLLLLIILVTINAAMSYGALTDGLTHYWSFDVNGTALDEVGTHNGTVKNPTWLASCKLKGCYNFTSTGNDLDSIQYPLITEDISAMSFWTKTKLENDGADPNWGNLLTFDGATQDYVIFFGGFTGAEVSETVSLFHDSGPGAAESAYIKDTDTFGWHHLVFNWNATDSTYKWFVDGQQKITYNSSPGWGVPDFPYLHSYKLYLGEPLATLDLEAPIDELAIWNRSLTQSEIAGLYNGGAGANPLLLGTPPDVNITNPTTNIRSNVQPDIDYIVVDNDNATLICYLYVDASLNQTDMSVSNNTASYFNATDWTDGVHSYFVRCNDGDNADDSQTLQYDLDSSEPVITSITPEPFNSTVFINYTMTIAGNITDNALYRVNRTIFYPNSSIYFNNYSGDLPNVTSYIWSETHNTTLMPNGYYTMYIDSADAHTNRYFPPALTVAKDQIKRQLKYSFAQDEIAIALVGGNVLGQFDSIDTTKLDDRYTFELNFKNTITPNSRMIFRLSSKYPIVYLPDSPYVAHFIIADKFWADFEGVPGQVTVSQFNETAYDVEIVTANPQDKFVFNSLGGLNENNLSIEFQVNNCIPNWACNGYAACNLSDVKPCNSVTDLNACGLLYGGDYSEFTPSSCNYCIYDLLFLNTTGCISGIETDCFRDLNFSTCCNLTGKIPADCPFGIVQEEGCVNSSCSAFDYSANDISGAVISTIGKGIITFGTFIIIIIVAMLIYWAWHRVR